MFSWNLVVVIYIKVLYLDLLRIVFHCYELYNLLLIATFDWAL